MCHLIQLDPQICYLKHLEDRKSDRHDIGIDRGLPILIVDNQRNKEKQSSTV